MNDCHMKIKPPFNSHLQNILKYYVSLFIILNLSVIFPSAVFMIITLLVK